MKIFITLIKKYVPNIIYSSSILVVKRKFKHKQKNFLIPDALGHGNFVGGLKVSAI